MKKIEIFRPPMEKSNRFRSFNDIKKILLDMEISELTQLINNYLLTINEMVDFSAKEIRKNRLKIDGYYFLLQEIEAIKVIVAKKLDININYEPTEDDVKAELIKMKQLYLSTPNGEAIMRLTYTEEAIDNDFAIPMFLKNWFYIDRAKETYLSQHKYYDVIDAFEIIKCNIRTFINNDSDERALIESTQSYKPTKEQRIESYFACRNFKALKTILRRDLRGRRGKDIAMVIVALEGAGCKMTGGFAPLFNNILQPIYGAEGSRQAVIDQITKIKQIKNDTQNIDPNAAKQLAEVTEKYKKTLL